MQRRAYGSGSIFERGGTYFGKWRVGDRQIKRKLGPVRKTGTRDGLTKAMAEARLRALMLEVTPPPAARMTVEEVGRHWLTHLEALGRKRSTMRSYRSNFENQIVKRNIGAQPVDRFTREEVERFVAACRRDGLSPKSTSHCLALLQSICEYAIKQGWASDPNPCKRVDRPKRAESAEIHFLEQSEIEALLGAVPDTDFGRVQRVLYLAAFMTGMRQGELLALRWMDVDWTAQRIRVRRNYVRGEFGTPKIKRGFRSVPLADRLAGELDRLYQRTEYNADDDLVFANPHTGKPMNGNAVLKSFQTTLAAAGVRKIRFHDARHTFGTRMAAAGVPMRTLQEWMGHRDFATTLIYADYQPGAHEAGLVDEAFGTQLIPEAPAEPQKTARLQGAFRRRSSAAGGTRTHTSRRTVPFEGTASADCATAALGGSLVRPQ